MSLEIYDSGPRINRQTPEQFKEQRKAKVAEFMTPELKEFLESIDFEVLDDIFLEVQRKCKVPEKYIVHITQDIVTGLKLPGYFGLYDQDFDLVRLDLTSLNELGSDLLLDPIFTLIHEASHRASRNLLIRFHEGRVANTGYFTGTENSSHELDFLNLNESVDDALSLWILCQYLRAAGKMEEKRVLRFVSGGGFLSPRIKLAQFMIEKVAEANEDNGMGWEEAWDELKFGFINSLGDDSEEVRNYLSGLLKSEELADSLEKNKVRIDSESLSQDERIGLFHVQRWFLEKHLGLKQG